MAKPPTSRPPRGKRTRRYSRNEAVNATPPDVISIFSHVQSTGDTSRQTQFYKDARILDSRLDQTCATRIHAIGGLDLSFIPPPGFENDAEALEIAKRCGQLWNSTRTSGDAVQVLAHATIEGYAGLAQSWIVDRLTGWHRPEFLINQSDPTLFVFDPDTLDPWFNADLGPRPDKPSERAFPLSDRPDSFIFYSPIGGRADLPWRRGALRSCVIRSLLKRMNIGHWSALLERWGQPQVYATIDYDTLQSESQQEADEIVEEVNQALRDLGRDWRAQVPKGVELKEIPVSVASDLHKNYVDWANTEDAIAILGQNLSTEAQGGSFAATSTHNRIRIEILRADCAALAEALTDQWCEPVVKYNWPGAPVPFVRFVTAPRTEWSLQDYLAGACTLDEYRTSKGHPAVADGSGAKTYSGPLSPGGGAPAGGGDGEPAKPSDTGEPGASKPPT